jgi:hypothetical protein
LFDREVNVVAVEEVPVKVVIPPGEENKYVLKGNTFPDKVLKRRQTGAKVFFLCTN